MANSNPTPADLQIARTKKDDRISYLGTKDELLAAGVAVGAMFPVPPKRRRYAEPGDPSNPVADNFSVSEKGMDTSGALYMVTRERGWEDPDGIRRKHDAHKAEREAKDKAREEHRMSVREYPNIPLEQKLRRLYPGVTVDVRCKADADTVTQYLMFTGPRQALIAGRIANNEMFECHSAHPNKRKPPSPFAHDGYWIYPVGQDTAGRWNIFFTSAEHPEEIEDENGNVGTRTSQKLVAKLIAAAQRGSLAVPKNQSKFDDDNSCCC